MEVEVVKLPSGKSGMLELLDRYLVYSLEKIFCIELLCGSWQKDNRVHIVLLLGPKVAILQKRDLPTEGDVGRGMVPEGHQYLERVVSTKVQLLRSCS